MRKNCCWVYYKSVIIQNQTVILEIKSKEYKISDASSFVTTTVLNTKISEVENKTPNHDKYITTSVFNKLTAASSAAG